MRPLKPRHLFALLVLTAAALLVPAAAALAGSAPADGEPVVTVTLTAPAGVWTGRDVPLTGTVSPAPAADTPVTIEWRPAAGGDWAPLTTTTLAALSTTFSTSWSFAADPHGYLLLRAGVPDGAGGTVYSGESAITVNPWNRHRVPYKFAHYIVIVVHEYRLYYYERGVLVRRFDVALGRPGFPTPTGTFHIYYKRKPGGVSALGACAMFYRHAGGIAIHGTDQPWLISRHTPRDFSHGCARMRNAQALWLFARCPVGTTVRNFR